MSRFENKKPEEARAYNLATDSDHHPPYTPNFVFGEFACHDGTPVILLHVSLCELLQQIRNHFGAAVTVASGFRTGEHNLKIGGAHDSAHLHGLAADIVVDGVFPDAVADYAETLGVGGVGRYQHHTHVDVRGSGRRWNG